MSWAEVYPWSTPAPGEPVLRCVEGQVRRAICEGALGAGSRLPSSRQLAGRLGVARATVVGAYEQLRAEGYVESRAGAGTFVAADLADLTLRRRPSPPVADPPSLAEGALDFGPVPPILGLSGEALFNTGRTRMDERALAAWRRAARAVARSLGPEHFGYSDPAGNPELRAEIAGYLRAARGVVCEPEQVVVTTGAQQAIDIATRVLVEPGAAVWVEDPGYAATTRALASWGADLRPIPVDASGLVVAEGLRTSPRARAAYVARRTSIRSASPSRWPGGPSCSPGPGRPAPGSSRTTTPPSSVTTGRR